MKKRFWKGIIRRLHGIFEILWSLSPISRLNRILNGVNSSSNFYTTKQEGEKAMAMQRLFAGLGIGILILGVTSAVAAETLNYKFYTRVVKSETFMVPDAAGHEVGFNVRDGVSAFENGDVAFSTTIVFFDRTKGVGSLNQYGTLTFRDESTIVTRTVGTTGGATGNVTGEIIHGTGRFQGIRGTVMIPEMKFFRLEKGESHPKSFGDGILNYTLPSK